MTTQRARYMAEYRRTPAGLEATRKQAKRDAARKRALSRLMGAYPEMWARLFAEELKKEGVGLTEFK